MIDFNNQVPSEIKILILSAISIQKYQIDHLLKCHNLLKLDLSCNAITNLPSFNKLTSLRILYLHQNQLQSIEPIAKLKLNYLTLFLNPISAQVSLRRQIIQSNKQLWALDFNAVTDEERYKELQLKSKKDRSRIPWPIVSLKQQISDPNQLMLVFYQELDVIRRIYEQCSVILLIQKFIRRFLGRKRFRELLLKKVRINNLVRMAVVQWKRFTHNKRDLNQMMALHYQSQFDRVKSMVKAYRQKKGKSIRELRCARLILKVLLDYRKSTNGIMKSIEYTQNFKMYFHRDQLELFRQLLFQIEQKYRKISQDPSVIMQMRQQQMIKYEDFQKMNVIYNSEVFTYRLPGQLQLELSNSYKKNMITYPATLSKISYCLMSVQLGIVRRWKLVSKFQGLNHLYPYIQQYEDQMPQRKPYFRQFKFTGEEKMRFRKCFQMINKFQMREYRQLLVVSLNRELCKELIKQIIFYNNQNPGNYFIVYFEKQFRQVTAALKIQRKYRAYKDVMRNGQTISQVINQLKQERCIMILQKWFRNIKYCHRNDFFKSIAHRIKQINSKILYIPIHIYLSLGNIKQQLRFREQNGELCKNQYDCFMKIDNVNILQIFSNLIQMPIEKQQNCDNTQQCDIYNLIHYQSECQFITYKQESWMAIIFQDIVMARNRLILLALQTYRFKYQTFVELYQQTEIDNVNLSRIEQIYQIDSRVRSMDVIIPQGKIIWLSDKSISERDTMVKLKFYRNNLNNKIKRNISKYPQCVPENIQLFYQLYYPIQQITQQITKQNEQNVTTMTGFKNVQIPESNLLQYMQHQQSFEKEHLNKLLKQSTNPSRQCYRNKSVSTKYTHFKTDTINRQQLQIQQQQVQKSSSFHYSTDQELERIKKLRETQQERLQQEKIERVKQFRDGFQSQKLEKSFELGFTTGQNVISKQADRHKFKVQIRSNVASLRQQVQLRQEQNRQIIEQPKKYISQKKIVNQDFSYIYPEDNGIVRNRWERDKVERRTNKYIHSVLPEEIYPLRIEFINEG